MGTRANLLIIQDSYQKKIYLERMNSGNPEELLPAIVKFCKSQIWNDIVVKIIGHGIGDLINDLELSMSKIGNFSYHYEINLIDETVKIWKFANRWVYAPENWKEKGWSCYEIKNGRYGYTNRIKGKLLFNMDLKALANLKSIKYYGSVINL